jgi:hypothetical protein
MSSFSIQTLLTKGKTQIYKNLLFCLDEDKDDQISKSSEEPKMTSPPVTIQTPTNLAVNALYAIANDIKTPSLTELQMLFGFGGKFRNPICAF